jgi:mono/diheme cytochrome c family protein
LEVLPFPMESDPIDEPFIRRARHASKTRSTMARRAFGLQFLSVTSTGMFRRAGGKRMPVVPLAVGCLVMMAMAPAFVFNGLYTKEQAQRGRALYDSSCADCHGTKLEGGTSTPLAGDDFFASWSKPELTLDDFYYIVRKTMPKDAAGTLTREAYTDIVAYILQQNGFPAGDKELIPDPTLMKAVRLDKPARDTTVPPPAPR